MAKPATNGRKVGALYASLAPQERVRLMAKLTRAHNPAEMNRLRDATPASQADFYNRALGLLRVLGSQVPHWITVFHMGMERDRFIVQHMTTESAHRWLTHHRLGDVWKLVVYPVTESEYRSVVELWRSEPEPLDAYAEHLAEFDGTEPGLHPDVAALLQGLPDDLVRQPLPDDHKPGDHVPPDLLADDRRRSAEIEARIRRLMDAAIERGELPKPRLHEGEPCLPAGVLSDWGEGTTPETYEPYGPGLSVPAVGELFGGDLGATWEIRPDGEAEAVRERRRELLNAFLSLAGVHRTERDALPSLDPPATKAEWESADKLADELHDEWYDGDTTAALALAAAKSHATHRAQLQALAAALETIQRDDFGGEDPLWPETRALLERALAEAERFRETWERANKMTLRVALREAMGLPPYPKPEEGSLDEPAPLPEETPDVEETLELIREWADAS